MYIKIKEESYKNGQTIFFLNLIIKNEECIY